MGWSVKSGRAGRRRPSERRTWRRAGEVCTDVGNRHCRGGGARVGRRGGGRPGGGGGGRGAVVRQPAGPPASLRNTLLHNASPVKGDRTKSGTAVPAFEVRIKVVALVVSNGGPPCNSDGRFPESIGGVRVSRSSQDCATLHGALRYIGHVGTGTGTGTGWTDRTLTALTTRLTTLATPHCPFADDVPRDYARNAHWVRPELVGDVTFRGWTSSGRLRHPSFCGLRTDLRPRPAQRSRDRTRLIPDPRTGADRADHGGRTLAVISGPARNRRECTGHAHRSRQRRRAGRSRRTRGRHAPRRRRRRGRLHTGDHE
jgi:hypothetical protein